MPSAAAQRQAPLCDVRDAFRVAGVQDLADDGPGERRAPGPTSLADRAGAGGDQELAAVDQEDPQRTGVNKRPGALCDQLEHALEVGLAADRPCDRGRHLRPRTVRSSTTRRCSALS